MLSTLDNPPSDAIGRFLTDMDRLDPLTIPGDWYLPGVGQVSAIVDRDGEILAMGWLLPRLGVLEIDVRVRPRYRGTGVGSRLFEHLTPPDQMMIAACDAAHESARRFLEGKGFTLVGVAFEQRWDGEPEDVPRAFETARLTDAQDRDVSWQIFREGMMDSWPPPPFEKRSFQCPDTRIQVAIMGADIVGVLASRRSPGTSNVGGIGVLQHARNHGVGRALLCREMAWAARKGLGVSMQVGSDNHRVLDWARNLGFWSVRTRTYYQIESKRI